MSIFEWLNNQLLKMDWLYNLVKLIVENVFKLDMDSKGCGKCVGICCGDCIEMREVTYD